MRKAALCLKEHVAVEVFGFVFFLILAGICLTDQILEV